MARGRDYAPNKPKYMMSDTTSKLISLALQTRRFGHCYVPVSIRQKLHGWQGETHENIKLTFCGWGRSLNTGGHKYKVHARYLDDKPVPTKVLKTL
jgi:hypothetical protein